MRIAHNNSTTEAERPEYHSAVEIDEDVGSWRDWVGPAAAVLFLLLGLLGLALTINGSI